MKYSHKKIFKLSETMYFNCYGFALNNPNWAILQAFREYAQNRNWFSEHREDLEPVLEKCVAELLRKYSTLRVVKSEKELVKGEYLIAFRIGEGDFHFMKKIKGQWFHKPGCSDVEKVSVNEVFSANWCDGRYTSRVVLFARRF